MDISKIQYKLFKWALAYKRDESDTYPTSIIRLADSMHENEIEKYCNKFDTSDCTEVSEQEISQDELPIEIKEAIFTCIQTMDNETLELLEKDSEFPNKDVKTPPPVTAEPEIPPGYVKADTRKDPGFFTPSLFKRPGDKTAKKETRVMDFQEFLKRINYRTHDGLTQNGHGQNLSGKS